MRAQTAETTVSEELFGKLVMEHWPRLVQQAEQYRGRAETAEDIAQRAVINAHGQLHRLKNPERAGRWLAKFVQFAGLKSVAKRARRRELLQAHGLPDRGHAKSPEELMLLELEDEALDRAIDELPERWRTVVLSRLAGLSVSETAAKLGIPEGSVKSYTHRAVCVLREAVATT